MTTDASRRPATTHLHEHFLDPAIVVDGAYVVPTAPGFSAQMRPETLARYSYPDGQEWAGTLP